MTQSLQYAFHEVWHVPDKDRPSFVARLIRGMGVFALIFVGVLASAALGLLGTAVRNSIVAGAIGVLAATAVSVALLLIVFWLLSPKSLPLRALLPGVVTKQEERRPEEHVSVRFDGNVERDAHL